MPASSSCTCAPRPARASRRPPASATWWKPGSAASSLRPSWRRILDNIGLPSSGTNLTYNNSGTIGPADADIIVSLEPGASPDRGRTSARCARELPGSFPASPSTFLPADIVSQILNFGLPAPIDIQVIGRNVESNRTFALKLLERLKEVRRHRRPAHPAALRPAQAGRGGGSHQGASGRASPSARWRSNLLITLSGSFQTNPTFFLNPKNGVTYNVITQAPQYRMDSLQALANIPLTGDSDAQPDILGSFATVTRGVERAVISHWNVQPVIDLYGGVQGRDLGAVADDVHRIVDGQP